MKTLKIYKLILVVIGLVVFTSCVEDDDFATPNTDVVEPVLDGNEVMISSVHGALLQEQIAEDEDDNGNLNYEVDDIFYTYPLDGPNLFMVGYVVSSDEAGNFFEELIIQDKPENPTFGIKVLIDVNPLFGRYEVGRKVFIKLNGLVVGISNGVLGLGPLDGERLGKIPSAAENDVILRSAEVATIIPMPLAFSNFSGDKTNLLVALEDVQFNREQATGDNPLSYASEGFDEFDGERILESCASSASVIFSTSTFADFRSLTLPSGRGDIVAILSKDFFGEVFNININSPEDVNLSNADRCDPIEIDCGLADAQGTSNIFSEDFETQTPFSPVTGNGWTNYIQAGTQSWEAYTDGGTNASLGISARIGSFQSGDASTIAWLITPAIDLDAQDIETFVFQTSNSFDDGSELELLFSPDWDGTEANIENATWGILPAATIVSDDDFFGDWIESGIVDLSCADGTIHIAFKYTGSGNAAFDGTYELDEISIDGL